eukprot:CAMPEP_0197273354 /NCGR_PEP_ID=MMETSP1432-20130617/11166_1 /TAXON_ID=44447 /ORGANISM="Pseudo-nitzschia delicatissima, Strain UNC1205" /LENGTH=152 /DNA_ID=CAMNT_0042739005 /DNA_START=108 /DNA_END=566 /DNA_ORIENTATION=+
MTMLTRMRQQQDPKSVTPIQSDDENDDASTIQNIFNNKNSDYSTNVSSNNDQQIDLFTPLSYDEADENQLVEFFTTIDIDVSFGECDSIINNLSKIPSDTTRNATKRRRLSNSGDSCSTAFSDESYDYDGDSLQRKQDPFGTGTTLRDAPIE